MNRHEPRPRFPRSVYGVGEEPDPRFTMANERTFLAWTRTALALIAGGVALELLGADLHASLRFAAALLLVASGIMLPIFSWMEWMSTERALRLARPLPRSHLGLGLALVVMSAGILLLLSLLFR